MASLAPSGPAKGPAEGGNMLQVSEKASEVIKQFLKDRKEPHSIRILMTAG